MDTVSAKLMHKLSVQAPPKVMVDPKISPYLGFPNASAGFVMTAVQTTHVCNCGDEIERRLIRDTIV